MFVAQENVSHNVNKKKFQKPNILRRKVKIPPTKLLKTAVTCESLEVTSPPVNLNTLSNCDLQADKTTNRKNCPSVHNVIKLPIPKFDETSPSEFQISNIEGIDIDVEARGNIPVEDNTLGSEQENNEHNSMNVESFLVGSAVGENITLFENDAFQSRVGDLQGKQKWSLDFIDDSHKIILGECDESQMSSVYLEEKPELISSIPMSAVSSVHQESYLVPVEEVSEESNVHTLSVDQFFTGSVKFKCDVLDCGKEFVTEQKLKKHKSVHNKDGTTRAPRQTTVECPVKKILEDGMEEPCGKIFHVREDLLKHLNEEHKPEDAIYRCEECGRQFFWASGLRAHARAHRVRRTRAALACAWPGCGRVFRQPCRLREHTRAHTGDKPYPCRYPNCGWSFRTASKLVRHARRHTGERRHACGACGRAFLRREHLRDHTARHHAARPRIACAHNGCQQSFTNMSSLYLHMKKVHRTDEDSASTNSFVLKDSQSTLQTDPDNLFMVTYMPKSEVLDDGSTVEVEPESVNQKSMLQLEGTEGEIACIIDTSEPANEVGGEDVCAETDEILEGEGHSARTHCTWPLPPRTHHFEQPDAYVLEEDTHVENSEISENNIYTVRSDLFLHGNVLTNEDSEHMAGSACAGALDAELLPPSVDLAQEELYTDAVDESSFRVFLLSGEDLT